MIVGVIVYEAVGILSIVLGLLLWKKQKISLVHDYHHGHVREQDVPAYTRLYGIGLLSLGAGCILAGLVTLISEHGWILFVVGFIVCIVLIGKAQRRYNGTYFG